MFCREQVAQLRDAYPRIQEKGAELVVVGSGKPEHAKDFAEERDLPFVLLTDPRRESYRAADLRRGMKSTFHLGTLKNAARALASGQRQGVTRGDPWQQGGAFVIAPGGEVLLEQRSEQAGDHVDPDDLVEALP